MSLFLKNIILDGRKQDIFIDEGKIKKIGKALNPKATEKIDGKGEKAILPGLINCHTHAAMSLFRGYADDLPLKVWLEKKIWPLEFKMTKNDIYWGTKLACLEMIKTGTTCFNEMYWLGDAIIEAAQEMGIRAKIGLVLLDQGPTGKKENVEKYWEKFRKKKLETISFSVAPHSIYTVSRENLVWAKNFAKKNSLILHIHISETQKEVKDCQKKWRMKPAQYLEKIGLLGDDVVLAHGVFLSDREIKILGKRRCSISYNPCSNLKLAAGEIFPYQKLRKAGVNICLGTDGAASNNNLDMFEEMKVASLIQKQKEEDPTVAPAREIFNSATKNGALALKVNSGRIKEGKLADLILVDLNQISLKPGHNLISDLVYSASGQVVSDSICNGKIIMRGGKVEGEDRIVKMAAAVAKRITKR